MKRRLVGSALKETFVVVWQIFLSRLKIPPLPPSTTLFTRGEGRAEEKLFRFSNLDDLSIFPSEINDDNYPVCKKELAVSPSFSFPLLLFFHFSSLFFFLFSWNRSSRINRSREKFFSRMDHWINEYSICKE